MVDQEFLLVLWIPVWQPREPRVLSGQPTSLLYDSPLPLLPDSQPCPLPKDPPQHPLVRAGTHLPRLSPHGQPPLSNNQSLPPAVPKGRPTPQGKNHREFSYFHQIMKIPYCRYIFLLICIMLLNNSGIKIFIYMLIGCCFGHSMNFNWYWYSYL